MKDFQHWGEVDETGQTIRDTQTCAVTGAFVPHGEGAQCFIKETMLFYRLTRQARNGITPEQRATVEEQIRSAKQLGISQETLKRIAPEILEWVDPEAEPKVKRK